MPPPASRRLIVLAVVGALLVALVAAFVLLRHDPLHEGSERYEAVTRGFYVGLAALEAGLLDEARGHFERAAELAPAEPAIFANLGVAHLRLGDLDTAAEPIGRAVELAPDHPAIALLAGRFEMTRGELDAGLAHLRRAVALDPGNLRAAAALAEEIERSGEPGADEEAQAIVDGIVERHPGNLSAIVEQARLAAKRGDLERLRQAVARLRPHTAGWPTLAADQHRALEAAVEAGDPAAAARPLALLRNVLLSVPAFLASRAALQVPVGLLAESLDRFLVLPPARATPAAADASLTFVSEPAGAVRPPLRLVMGAVPDGDAPLPALFGVSPEALLVLDDAGSWPFAETLDGPSAIVALDWNNDFLNDVLVAGAGGVRLLVQDPAGTFTDVMGAAGAAAPVTCDCVGAWAADIEMDGDIDVVLAARAGDPLVLRNRGDGTWDVISPFAGVPGARAFVWADLDEDADPDAAFLDAAGTLHVFANRQAGDFVRVSVPAAEAALVALAAADIDADGRIDLVTLDGTGAIHRLSLRGDSTGEPGAFAWDRAMLADGAATRERLDTGASGGEPGAVRLFAADLDNNGAIDLVASGPAGTAIWLADERHVFHPAPVAPALEVFGVMDTDGDGRLDLVGIEDDLPVRARGQGDRAYHWVSVRARAQDVPGDQRINSFAIGGDIEVRSGLLTQKQVISSGPAHFGLGTRAGIDVARILWPNGVAQAEFDLDGDGTVVAEQRLKGSCPWVFAYDGSGMRFVTDFLWRSPLGLRINARDTAGVAQTEDWITIRGDQLQPRDGVYDIRITAELWETHFFDHVSLLVVDAPPDVDVFVDERFAPAQPPALAVQPVAGLRPVAGAWDEEGRDVTARISARDGQYLAAFSRGRYQGIAREHAIELDLGQAVAAGRPQLLVAHGWVYPTDSSINVAIGQGSHEGPQGVSLEALGPDGTWSVVRADIGFPAGKNKTMLVDLRGAEGARRLRLRTNLEISWDLFALADRVEAPLRTVRLPARAELRYRGFSETVSPRGDTPETPHYERIATTAQRWRDLTGYYTRFGDVGELLAGVDDRYVIMNAGDELRLLFDEPPPPPPGWQRSFVLIGDGWEKDGDYNTRFSQTVLPLPAHDDPEYTTPPGALEDDPVYRRHPGDWERYHTRFVTPRPFVRGLRATNGAEVADGW